MRVRRRAVVLGLFLWLVAGCATDHRFREHRVRVSPRCYLVLVEDRRTHLCLATYRCLGGGPGALTVVPSEVCAP